MKQLPLSEDDVWDNDEIMLLNTELALTMNEIMKLVRLVEKAHGIVEQNASS